MTTSSALRDKRAVVFGASGSIGSAVARELAAEGAEVFLAGRTAASIEPVAEKIADAGGGRMRTRSMPSMRPQSTVNRPGESGDFLI